MAPGPLGKTENQLLLFIVQVLGCGNGRERKAELSAIQLELEKGLLRKGVVIVEPL